jgi:hypothetical protein
MKHMDYIIAATALLLHPSVHPLICLHVYRPILPLGLLMLGLPPLK